MTTNSRDLRQRTRNSKRNGPRHLTSVKVRTSTFLQRHQGSGHNTNGTKLGSIHVMINTKTSVIYRKFKWRVMNIRDANDFPGQLDIKAARFTSLTIMKFQWAPGRANSAFSCQQVMTSQVTGIKPDHLSSAKIPINQGKRSRITKMNQRDK